MFENLNAAMLGLFATSLWETVVMVGVSGFAGALIGIPLGVLLRLTDKGGAVQNLPVNRTLGAVVNAARSTPFIILLVAVIPLTRALVGTSIGTVAAIVPLTLSAAPFVARLVESALREVDGGLVEAAQAMGANTWQSSITFFKSKKQSTRHLGRQGSFTYLGRTINKSNISRKVTADLMRLNT